MATSYRSKHLRVMRDNERQMTAMFARLARYGASQIMRAADSEGNIPRSATYDLQRDIGERIVRTFLGRNSKGEMAAYEVLPDGSVMPLSSYMRILWQNITDAIQIEVEREAALMDRLLPDDIKTGLALLTGIVREQEDVSPDAFKDWFQTWKAQGQRQVFAPNPLAGYDMPHLWVDPNGYRLSDRIWRTAGATRRKVDLFLEEGITQGRGALSLSKDLERFLHPGRKLKRTNTPYGTDASYDAMRLARTEISRAAAQAHEAAAKANPFVKKMKWKLSPQHSCCDICDTYADREFSFEDWPTQPAHPQCMCYAESVVDTDNRREILDQAREEIRAARRAMMGGPVRAARTPSGREVELQQEIDSMRPIMESVIEAGDPTGAGLKSVIDTMEQQLDQERKLNQALWDAFEIAPDQASEFEWQQLADQLRDDGMELYDKYTKEGIRSSVAQTRGAKDSGWMVIGKEQVRVKQGAFSASAGRRMEGEIWAEAKDEMRDAMGQLLQRAGYSPRDISQASFEQRRRLLEELGTKGLLYTGRGRVSVIDKVPVEAREEVVQLIDFDLAAIAENSAVDPLALPTLDAYGKLELSDLIRATKIIGGSF